MKDNNSSKTPPHNLEAEEAILAAILIDNQSLNPCMEILKSEDFYKQGHRLIYQNMLHLSEKGEPVDLVTLSAALQSRGVLEQAGGASYLSHLVDSIPVPGNVESYAKIVKDKSLLRGLIHVSGEIVTDCFSSDKDVSDVIDQAESKLFAISENRDKKSFTKISNLVVDSYKLIEKLFENKGELTGLDTGFKDFNEKTNGLQPGDLIIVAGRPSMGKTAFALNLAVNAAKHSRAKIAIFSLEMGKEQLVMRMMTSEARINAGDVSKGVLTDRDWPKLSAAADQLSQLDIFIDDQAGLSSYEIRAKCRRLAKERGLDFILIDYLQLMRGSDKASSREQEISEISRSLKALAKELHVPVVALSQLNRSLENRVNKRPLMSDLRESGAIEQDADVIAFIYRDVVYNPETEDQNVAEIIIGKQRNGPIGTTRLSFINSQTRFEDLAFDSAYDNYAPASQGQAATQDYADDDFIIGDR